MLKTRFISNARLENIDEIKIAALYYDKIEIARPTFRKQWMRKEFTDNLHLLVQEGLIEYVDIDVDIAPEIDISDKNEVLDHLFIRTKQNPILDVLLNRGEFNYPIWWEFTNEEINELSTGWKDINLEDYDWLEELDQTYAFTPITEIYYESLFKALLDALGSDSSIITSSLVVNNGVKRLFNSQEFLEQKKLLNRDTKLPHTSLAFEAIKVALPNVSMLHMEDILEIRYKLKDELMFFRREMQETESEVIKNADYKNLEKSLSSIVDNKIHVPLIELERKMKSSHIKVLSKLLNELRTAKPYVPLLGSFFLGLPTYMSVLASLGMIGASTYLEARDQKIELKNNGMYYLLDLKRNYNPN
ncbi:hypothetical protein AB0764_26495 (plasmid) [Priestia megaterium]|uniref:hypothetical protein n=1 Tax=Priestia TaxID=2800373 RepID=UPI00387824B8